MDLREIAHQGVIWIKMVHGVSYTMSTEGLSPGIKPWVREAYYSLPSTVEVKNGRSYTSTPAVCLHGVDRDNFSLQLLYFSKRHANNNSVNKYRLAGRAAGSGYGPW